MVLKGQFLERPTLIPLEDGTVLEGVAHRGSKRPGLLVLPPPPVEGSGMDHVVGAELAYAVTSKGYPSLRFNYRGVGGSQGTISKRPEDWLTDAQHALQVASENVGGGPLVIASIGASDVIALRLGPTVQGLALISPSIVTADDVPPLAAKLTVVLPELDDRHDRGRWATLLERLDGAMTVVPGATRAFQRNLPVVGKAVATLMGLLDQAGSQPP